MDQRHQPGRGSRARFPRQPRGLNMPGTQVQLRGSKVVVRQQALGPRGPSGVPGWSPIFASYDIGEQRSLLKLVDWVGGGGTKPTVTDPDGKALFIGPNGLTIDQTEAVKIGQPTPFATVAQHRKGE